MGTKTASRSASGEREHHRSNLWHQAARFVGLFLSPFAGLLTSWLIHLWVVGISIHWGKLINWEVRPSPVAVTLAVCLITLLTVMFAYIAYRFTEHRQDAMRNSLAGSVLNLGIMFAVNVGTGPSYLWSPLFVFCCWAVAVIWSIARLDVTRNDKRTDEDGGEDSLMSKLGISKLTRFKPKVIRDENGEPQRVDVKVKHAPGETVKVIQDGIDTIESAAGGPPGMSTATGDPDHADESTLSVMLANPFRKHIPVGPLTAPGGTVADWASFADYADGRPAFMTIAGGKHMPSATSYALIGTTRAGKTATETQMLTDWGSRYDFALLYLNQAKGLQDIRPLLPITEAAVIAEDGERGLGEYELAFKQIQAAMIYRQDRLAQFAISAWSPRCADPDPDRRPSRVTRHGRETLERMPFFLCHVGEADAILNSGRASETGTFIVSKGLSLGIATGWSLQRPDWKSIPTSMRANIGMWMVHGLNGTDEEDFVIDEAVRKAGAHPGKWGQRKPGQFYMIGPGIDETRFPVALKTRFLIGSDKDENGKPLDYDTLNDRYMAEMLRRNLASAANMCKLDQGTVDAMGGWWETQVAKTDALRIRMLNPELAPEPVPDDPEPPAPARKPTANPDRKPPGFAGVPAPQVDDDAEDLDPAELEDDMNEFHADAADVAEVEGVPLYGDTPQEVAETRAVDLTAPFVPPQTDYDPLADSEEDSKPAAMSPAEADEIITRTLVRMLDDPKYADRKVPGTAIVTPVQVLNESGVKSRPWVSANLSNRMIRGGDVSDGIVMEKVGNPRKGEYRLRRADGN